MPFDKSDLCTDKLPTNREVIRYLIYLKHKGTSKVPKKCKLLDYAEYVIKKISKLWERACIPIVKRSTIRKKISYLVKSYYSVIKTPSKNKSEQWDKLFRISYCKCELDSIVQCNCSFSRKIPLNFKDFFIDQCGPRNLSFNDQVDRQIETPNHDPGDNQCHHDVNSLASEYVPEINSDEEFEIGCNDVSPLSGHRLKVLDLKLRNYSSGLDRSNTSNRVGALLACMLLEDIRFAINEKRNKKDLSDNLAKQFLEFFDDLVIDKNKIFRERVSFRSEAKEASRCDTVLECISFDGKKDLTLQKKIVLNKTRLVQSTREHITIVKEPGSKFIGYTSPEVSTGEGIQKSIMDFLKNENYSTEKLLAVSCDGTVTNTGHSNGVIPFMERYLERPLQWLVCLFHFNELPMNALLKHFYGKQKGPGIWPGEFGKEILECEKYAVAETFPPITSGVLPENINEWDIRDDQRYLYHMVRAVNDGICDEQLASLKPGPLSTARWLSTACRILRLYVTKKKPCNYLKKLAEFVVKVYAPFWFLVKQRPSAVEGSRNVFKYISWLRELPLDVQLVIRPVVENNSYFFHPENILLSMVTETEDCDAKKIRSEGYAKIIAARKNPPPSVRKFVVPKGAIDFYSTTHTQMIDWSSFRITEPPCLQFYSDADLKKLQNSNDIINIPDFLCHSQNTERFVHVVSESCTEVADEERLGHIFAKLSSRERYSKLESRKDLA